MDDNNFKEFNIGKDILKSLGMMGYKNATKVQKQVIPLVLQGKDIIVKSQTGSGKTAAFGIPICEKIEIEEREPKALVLTPTRELCIQVKEDITNIGRFKRIRCSAVFGKQPFDIQVRELKQRVHVVVGTPGRTFDHLQRGTLTVEKLEYLIIDEADKMLDMGFIDQVKAIINVLPKSRNTMLFSATMPEEIENLCKKYMISPIKIEIEPENITTENINQELYEVKEELKDKLLINLIYVEDPESCIIFCRTKENVDILSGKLKDKGFSVGALHGGMFQEERLKTMEQFKRGEFAFLVATDVAARGIDVESLTHIINYDVPVEKESYVHRIGRTGRAGKKGKAITMAPPNDRYIREIEEYIGYSIPRKEAPNREEIEEAKKSFNKTFENKPMPKLSKSTLLNREITKLYIGAGKKKKIRAGDIVGAITSIEGVSSDNIGIIDIQDTHSYVDILGGKGELVLNNLNNFGIKGKNIKVEKANK